MKIAATCHHMDGLRGVYKGVVADQLTWEMSKEADVAPLLMVARHLYRKHKGRVTLR